MTLLHPLQSLFRHTRRSPGAPPGIDHVPETGQKPAEGAVRISCFDFSTEQIDERCYQHIDHLLETPRPDWATTRWIDVQGVDPYTVQRLRETFKIHTLAAEDALNLSQRPKVEEYDSSLFVVLRMLRLDQIKLINEQVSFFYFRDTLITVQEAPGDVWDPVRARLRKPTSRFRLFGAPYLLYALIDAIVDHIFPLLEQYFEELDAMELRILEDPRAGVQQRIHAIKRELSFLRQAIWPLRDIVSTLGKDEFELFPKEVETYFRDVYDHAVQANDAIEMYREMANSLQDLLMAAASNRMNEVMKALTIMATLFLPLTFFAGVYGMNFETFPELAWPYAYPAFWAVSLLTIGGLLYYFKRRGWIGK